MSAKSDRMVDLYSIQTSAALIVAQCEHIRRHHVHLGEKDSALYRAIIDSTLLHIKHLKELIDQRLP